MTAYVLRDFNDAGTGESFKAGQVLLDMKAGAFANYKEAGLVRSATADEVAANTQAAQQAAEEPAA